MKKIVVLFSIFLLVLPFAACAKKQEVSLNPKPLSLVASFYPIYVIAENVISGAQNVTLETMAQPQGGCLHDYQLTTGDMKKLERADLFLINGGGMESFLEQAKTVISDARILDTSVDTTAIFTSIGAHEAQGEQQKNTHIWLMPENAARQAQTIEARLCLLDPKNASIYRENTMAFVKEMTILSEHMRPFGEQENGKVAVFHEGFLFLTEQFGFQTQLGIFADEQETLSPKSLVQAIEQIEQEGIRVLFAADDAGREIAEKISAQTGAKVYILDPVTGGDASKGSYVAIMEKNIETMKEAARANEDTQ